MLALNGRSTVWRRDLKGEGAVCLMFQCDSGGLLQELKRKDSSILAVSTDRVDKYVGQSWSWPADTQPQLCS